LRGGGGGGAGAVGEKGLMVYGKVGGFERGKGFWFFLILDIGNTILRISQEISQKKKKWSKIIYSFHLFVYLTRNLSIQKRKALFLPTHHEAHKSFLLVLKLSKRNLSPVKKIGLFLLINQYHH